MRLTYVPEELKGIKQWSVSYSQEELKRPKHSNYKPNGALSASEADKLAGELLYRGFYVTPEDPYILIDIDHIENPNEPWSELPDSIRAFMLARQTYWEISPSGKGLRGVLKLPSVDIKPELNTSRALLIGANGNTSSEAEAHFGAPWMTITGNKTSYSVDTIATITLEDLQQLFSIKLKSQVNQEISIDPETVAYTLPSLADVRVAISGIPLDQNPRVKRAYKKIFGQEYQHYDFWMKIMMAINHYALATGKKVECLDIFHSWSESDASYESYEDVFEHWKSLDTKESQITYKTLFKIRNEVILQWPVLKKQSKLQVEAGVKPKPMITAYENFLAVIKYYNFSFCRDELCSGTIFEVYIMGDSDILNMHFRPYDTEAVYDKYYGPFNRDIIIPIFASFLEYLGFVGISHVKVREFLTRYLSNVRQRVNFIKEYISTPLVELPPRYQENIENVSTSTLATLFNCLTIEYISQDQKRELRLYQKYYLAWLMNLMKNLYYSTGEPNINNCILILTGREQIRKTSHFKVLFPTFLRKYIAFTTHGFKTSDNMRDLAKIARSNLVVIWDEVEQFLTAQTESNFKKIIDNNPQTIIDKYEVQEKTITPIAIYGATSNQREFKLGDQGSRRMFIIPVSWVDTDAMMKICWHGIFREILQMYHLAMQRGSQPWLLTEDELKFQTQCHGSFKAKTDFDMILEEMFDTSETLNYSGDRIVGISSVQRDTSGQLYSTRSIQVLIQQYDSNVSIKRPVLVHALERFCGRYTGTDRKSRTLAKPFAKITKGQIQQGIHKRWILPPLSAEASKFKNVFEGR